MDEEAGTRRQGRGGRDEEAEVRCQEKY